MSAITKTSARDSSPQPMRSGTATPTAVDSVESTDRTRNRAVHVAAHCRAGSRRTASKRTAGLRKAAARTTVGGYAKLGVIDERDISWLAQVRPGRTVRFELVNEI